MNDLLKTLLTIATVPLVTLLTSWLKRCNWKREYKILLMLLISLVFAVAISIAEQQFDVANVGGTLSVIAALAFSFYEAYFKKTALNETLERQ